MAKLTLLQIKEAFESTIAAAFPGVTVHKTGVMKDFTRPSFYVKLTNVDSDDRQYNRHRTIAADIHYFPTDRYQNTIELLDTQDSLESAFGLNMAVGSRVVTFDGGSGDVVDGVLHYTLNFTFVEDQEQTSAPAPLMEELDFNGQF